MGAVGLVIFFMWLAWENMKNKIKDQERELSARGRGLSGYYNHSGTWISFVEENDEFHKR